MVDLYYIEDDPGIAWIVKEYLEQKGFKVTIFVTLAQAGQALKEHVPTLVLLDWNMPDGHGDGLCRWIRKNWKELPIIFLTVRGDCADIVSGFENGGDDYIVKPFELDELGARVAAHLRREQRTLDNRAAGRAVRFFGELAVDYGTRSVSVNGNPVLLTKREFDILELLSKNMGQVFDRERIYDMIWGIDGEGNSGTVMEHIRKLRAKLAEHTLHSYIETVWGCGYKWNA